MFSLHLGCVNVVCCLDIIVTIHTQFNFDLRFSSNQMSNWLELLEGLRELLRAKNIKDGAESEGEVIISAIYNPHFPDTN